MTEDGNVTLTHVSMKTGASGQKLELRLHEKKNIFNYLDWSSENKNKILGIKDKDGGSELWVTTLSDKDF